MKKKLIGLYLLGALLGLALLSYPIISNTLYENRQDGVVQTYQSIAEDNLLAEARAEALEAARQYNQQLASGLVSLDDPFLTVILPEADGSQKSILDITGTGVIATLSIPSLGLELPVYYGTDLETLEHGIGTLEISSLPVGGKGAHTVLCGHSGLSTAKLFSDLELMEEGDLFFLSVLGEMLAYEVDQIVTVKPEDLSYLEIDPEQDYCTLLTCTPYGINTHRLLVRGVRTELAEPPSEIMPEKTEPVPSLWLKEYLTSLAVGAVLALIVTAVVLLWHLCHAHYQGRRQA